ncbi:MAG TPA: DUF72 domain-containing protein [Polyangia bacterium]|nr:DUF72 domain-containing protein [Polyangia bacterium]HVY39625.1 DUF72 domain-containing protein [Polyangia bacterium]
MQLLIGTSGFSYTAWRGGFYPEKLPEAKMLAYYAGIFPAVEINNSFYRMPTAELLGRWAAETPPGFKFALKSPRRITHEKRLADAAAEVERLAAAARGLGDKLGPVLFQLPPNLKKDLPRLDDFLAALPRDIGAAVEFRHASWFADDVYATLRARKAALCIADAEDLTTPVEATADWGYLRLRREDYEPKDIARWGETIAARPWTSAHVFFKHEDTGKGPVAAERLAALMKAGQP